MRLLMSFVEMVQFALLDTLVHVSIGYMMAILLSSRDIRKKDEERSKKDE